jgi:hypothetical protein
MDIPNVRFSGLGSRKRDRINIPIPQRHPQKTIFPESVEGILILQLTGLKVALEMNLKG